MKRADDVQFPELGLRTKHRKTVERLRNSLRLNMYKTSNVVKNKDQECLGGLCH